MPTSPSRWINGHRRSLTLTPLNEATSEAYQRCHGHHVPSGLRIVRDFGSQQRELPVCFRCGVPYGVKLAPWLSNR